MKNFGEKGAWAYPRTAQFFEYPLLSQEHQMWQVYSQGPSEQKPLKILEKSECRRIQVLLKFLSTPYYLRYA